MVITTIIIFMLAILTSCSSDGNIRLMEEDVAVALRTCLNFNDGSNSKVDNPKRQRRTSENLYDQLKPRTNANAKHEVNQNNHGGRNTSYSNKMHVSNGSHTDYGAENGGEKFVNAIPRPVLGNSKVQLNNKTNSTRIKRNELLITKDDNEQCLSQCVFANLQVVDSRGIPREAELWNKIQSSVTSQQSRTLLQDQTRACFQELQSESEDNGCSYSNKLERCLMLRFSDRKINGTRSDPSNRKN